MSIYEQLIGAVRIVEDWPEVEQGEEYELRLTPKQHDLVVMFIWRHYGVAQMPVLVNASYDEH